MKCVHWWSQADRDKVAGMLRDKMSATMIAPHFLGRSRNAIIGLVHRDKALKAIGLPGTRPPAKPRKPRQPRAKKSNVIPFPLMVAQHVSTAPVAQPRAPHVVSNNTRLMVADYLKKHGARRFERGESVDYFGLQAWLRDRGYTLTSRASLYTLSSGGRPKVMPWRNVVQFVDKLRQAEGLQPILRSA